MENRGLKTDAGGIGGQIGLEDAVRSLALVLSNQIVYDRLHRLTEESFQESYERVFEYLREHGSLVLGGAKGHLIANTRYIELKTRNLQTLAQALEEREVAALEFHPGLTTREYHHLLDILCMPLVAIDEGGGVGALLDRYKVENINLSDTRFEKLIDDDDVVVNFRYASSGDAYLAGDPQQDSATLLAYLADETDANAQRASCAIGGLLGDAHLIAEIIFQTATAKSGDGEGGCDFDVLADCVRKVVNVLSGSPASESAGGRLVLMGALDDLKEELLFAIQADDEDNAFAQSSLDRIVENAKERLSIEKVFGEYARKRALLESRERRIVDFLRHKGFGLPPEELEYRLKRQGVSAELWEELWDKSFRRTPVERDSGGAVNRFEAFAKRPPSKAASRSSDFLDQLINNMADVELEMVALVEQTRARIDSLGEIFAGALTASRGPSRDDVVELARMLVSIGHGLAEPIKMLGTSIEIVRSSNLGRLSESQHAVLQMAAISGQRVQTLANQLMAVAETNQT